MKFIEKLLSKNSSRENLKATSIGFIGEETAVKLLKKEGYKILERNYKTKMGEIDIIAQDGEYTCFVEVKLRKNDSFGSPGDFIDERKKSRIIKTAQYYALENNIYDLPLRFDAVLITADIVNNKKDYQAQIIKNAFILGEIV